MTEVIAHRGASTEFAGNTLAAFRKAVELGADWIELDVRRTADDVLIVHHDAVLEDGRRLRQTLLADLPDSVATLAEALEACGTAKVNVEIKNTPDDPDYDAEHQISDAVAGLAAAYRDRDDLLISSFNLDTVKRIKAVNPDLQIGLIVGVEVMNIDMLVDYAAHAGVKALVVSRHAVNARLIQTAHEAGLIVNAWTVNEADQIADLVALGIDGIISDDVRLARNVIAG